MEYAIGILIGIVLNLYFALTNMDTLMMLILPIHEYSICFHLFVSSLMFFLQCFYSFLSTGLLHPWLNIFLGILFLFF